MYGNICYTEYTSSVASYSTTKSFATFYAAAGMMIAVSLLTRFVTAVLASVFCVLEGLLSAVCLTPVDLCVLM